MNKLVTVVSDEVIAEYKDSEDITLLYPLTDYCVGYNTTYDIDKIDDYVLINRILNDQELDKLELVLNNSNIKGIVFDDLGILDIIKNLNIKKILLLDHLANSTSSINYYLDYVDSIVVSSDLTEEEIAIILDHAKKPLVLYAFGLKGLMYSRRKLLSNYNEYHNLNKELIADASINDQSFKIVENEYGTKFYGSKYYNALNLIDHKNILFCWYEGLFLEHIKLKQVIEKNDLTNIETSRYFLDKKTIFKVGDIDA